jgi:para-nitrobenzyl esterase
MSANRLRVASRKSIVALLLVALCALPLLCVSGCGSSTTASTKQGKVEGEMTSNEVIAFKGIPFAAPPVGELRFMPPQDPKPWDDTLKAFEYSEVEPQPMESITGAAGYPQSEDCLYLNVWTPKLDDTKRPVMFWIHGGAYSYGTANDPMYDGANLADRGDVVVVTANYRLGPLGFLYLADVGGQQYAQSGNLGMLDQVAALKWVKENISSFGGDPNNVTIFGQSAGGGSVCNLLTMPAAKGLFRRAIAESGAASMVTTTAEASDVTGRYMQAAGVTDVAGLKALPIKDIIQAESDMSAQDPYTITFFSPVVDGNVIPEPPLHAIAKGSASDVDLLIGANLNEFNIFAYEVVPVVSTLPLSVVAGASPDLQQSINATGMTADAIAAVYKQSFPEYSDGEITMKVMGDEMFWLPAIRVGEAQSGKQPNTFMYLFTWPSPKEPRLGSTHAIELAFVWGNLKGTRLESMIGTDPPQKLADIMMDSWIAFAKNGNPNSKNLPKWDPYNTQTRTTMILNLEPTSQNDPYAPTRQVWNALPFDGTGP